MREIKYNDCAKYVQHELGIKLYDYQKDVLKAMCDGVEFRSSRGIGRTFVAECFGKYVAHLYSRNDYTKEPSMIFPYTVAMHTGLVMDTVINKIQCSYPDIFKREYECR